MIVTTNTQPVPPAVRALGEHVEVTLHISRADAAAIGTTRLVDLTEWFASALRTLAALKTGEVVEETADCRVARVPATVNTWHWGINDLEIHLLPALRTLRTEAVRAHALAGGTVTNLAVAMNTVKSTAQSRREKAVEEGDLWLCSETRHDTRGDCDSHLWTVKYLTNLGTMETCKGEGGFMCGSHGLQAAQVGEVSLGRLLTSA